MSHSYKDKIYGNYRTHHNDLLYGRPTLERIRNSFQVWNYYYGHLLPAERNVRILDIGCGEGGLVYFLREQGFERVEGIDISEEQIKVGQELGIAGLIQGDLRTFLGNEQGFDLIIARDVIEHFPRQEAFDLISLVFNSLKPGGTFVMQVPNGEGIHMASIYYGDYTHESPYSHLSVRQVFLNIGFREVRCYPLGPVPKNFTGMIRKVLWDIRVCLWRFSKMIETGSGAGIFTSNLIAVGKK